MSEQHVQRLCELQIGNIWTGTNTSTCGNYNDGGFFGGGATGAAQRGADVLVPLPTDDYWDTPTGNQNNSAALLSWVDNRCGDCKELFSSGSTPLNGVLRDMYRYLSVNWTAPNGAAWNAAPKGPPSYNTPLTGTERSCRLVNVLLITDGGETCPNDNNAAQAQAAATALKTGWTIGGTAWTAKTYVIDVRWQRDPVDREHQHRRRWRDDGPGRSKRGRAVAGALDHHLERSEAGGLGQRGQQL